jgi:hypothetical protein
MFASSAIYAAAPIATGSTSGSTSGTQTGSGSTTGLHATSSTPIATHSTGAALGLGAGLSCTFIAALAGLVIGASLMF